MLLCLPPILHIVYPKSALSCSKGSRGLSVPLRVSGIFTATTISPSSWLRQCPDRYTIRAGRNLPDKEFRYLRTVIVTAAVYRGFFRHRAGVRPYASSLNFAKPCVFGKQSPGPFLCALRFREGPLLPKLRGQFAEFLSHDSLEHLGILSLPTCVGLRYGLWQTGPQKLFSGVWLPRLSDRPRALRTVGAQQGPSLKPSLYLPPSTGYSVSRRACHNSVTPLILPQVAEY